MKPTDKELQQALSEAERMREAGEDGHFLSKTLLYQRERLHHLEEVRKLAERLVRFGQDEHEHALLVRALDAARRAEEQARGAAEDFGLG